MRPLLTILAAALLFGCGSDGPVAPRSGGFLQVAGTYAGPATFTAFTLEPEPITGTARFVVVQSDAQVTISGSFNFAYWDAPLACGAVTGTINETGFFTPTTSGRVPGPGRRRPVRALHHHEPIPSLHGLRDSIRKKRRNGLVWPFHDPRDAPPSIGTPQNCMGAAFSFADGSPPLCRSSRLLRSVKTRW